MHTIGGHAVTHLLSISKKNCELFTVSDFQVIWEGLYHFFSFANGGWSTPVLPVGYNSNGEIVFEQLQPRIVSLWCDSTRNWFNDLKLGVLDSLFPGFMTRIDDPDWGKAIRTSLYWYVNSERSLPSLDTTIILAQSALELLAWQYLVIDKKILAVKDFRKFTAAENIRRVLTEEKIEVNLPGQCNALLARFGNSDGPFALTELRNDIIHPVPKQPLNINEMNQVWDLSMFYIERILLNLCSFSDSIPHRCMAS